MQQKPRHMSKEATRLGGRGGQLTLNMSTLLPSWLRPQSVSKVNPSLLDFLVVTKEHRHYTVYGLAPSPSFCWQVN